MNARWLAAILWMVTLLAAPLGAQDLDLARSQAAAGDRSGARVTLESALPQLPPARRAEALLFLSELRDDWATAEADLGVILDEHRETRWAQEALWRIGLRALTVGEAGRAHDAFGEALAGNPRPDRALDLRFRDAQALLLMGQPGEARARLRPLLDELPPGERADRVVLLLAACAQREQDPAEALRRSLDLLGRDSLVEPAALLQAGRALVSRSEAALALEYLSQVAHDFPDTPAGAEGRVLADSLRRVLGRERPSPSDRISSPPKDEPLDPGDDPRLGDPGLDDPGADDPSVDDPGVDDPSADDPSADDPSADDPGVQGPFVSDPGSGVDERGADDPGAPSVGDSVDVDPALGEDARTDLPRVRGDAPEPSPDSGDTPGARGSPGGIAPPEDEPSPEDADHGSYVVLIGPFDRRIEALSVLSRLRRQGETDALLDRTPDGFTVRVGPMVGRSVADAEAIRLRGVADAPARVVEER